MVKYMGVDQTTSRASMGAVSPAPVIQAPNVGGDIVKAAVGIGSQLISEGMKSAGARRIGKKALEITESLESSLDLSVIERDKKVTSMIRAGIESGDIRYQDVAGVKNAITRTETTRVTLPDGTIVNKAKDGSLIAPQQPTLEGKLANQMVENGTKIELAFPKATKVFQDMIGTKMPNALDNAPVIEAATNLTNFFETVDNQTLIAQTGMTEESYKMALQNRGAMFKTLLSKLESEVASVAVAQKLGAGDGDINMNAPQLAMKAFYDDLRVQMTPQRLRALGLSPDTVEKMASTSLTTMKTFAEDATKMGAVNAVARMRDRVSVTMELNILEGKKDALSRLSTETRDMLDKADFTSTIMTAFKITQEAGIAPANQDVLGRVLVNELILEPTFLASMNSLKSIKDAKDPASIRTQAALIRSAGDMSTLLATGRFNPQLDTLIAAGDRIQAMFDNDELGGGLAAIENDLKRRLADLKAIRKGVQSKKGTP